MYPVLFRIGSFEVTSFGALVAIAALVGLWLSRQELARSHLPQAAIDAALARSTPRSQGSSVASWA